MTDTARLQNLIRGSGLKKGYIANALGLTYVGFRKKEIGQNEFNVSEVVKLKSLLKLSDKDVSEIFLQSK